MSDHAPTATQPVHKEADAPATALAPFNFESGFGGVDAKCELYSQKAIRPRLFDFSSAPTKKTSVNWPSAPGVAQQFASADFAIPEPLAFSWLTEDVTDTRAGETKASFQSDITTAATAGASAFGFSAEFSVTFDEHDFEETYAKYVARYERQQVYTIAFAGSDPKKWLSARAAADLASAPPDDVVEFYGTHYMRSAIFGGLRVFSAKLDIRDEIHSEDLKTAITLSFKSDDGTGSAGTSTSSATVQKLHRKMSVTQGRTIGGKAGDTTSWRQSLFTDPAVIGYELRPISELAPEARRADIDAAVERRLGPGKVQASKPILAMRVPISYHANDHGTGAKKSITVARPSYRYGWYYIGCWALPQRNFPDGYESLIFANAPGTSANPALRPAAGFDQLWDTGEMGGMGLYKAKPITGYTGIGDTWENTRDPTHIPDVQFYGLVRNDLTRPSQWLNPSDTYWDDHGTGRSIMGSAYIFAAGETPDPAAEQTLWVPPGGTQAYMFRGFKSYGFDDVTPLRLDMSKVKVLTNSWLDD